MVEFGVCETPDILRVVYFIKIIINIIKIIIPIVLIIFVTIDCAKGVINEDKKFNDCLKVNSSKIISAIFIFTIPTIVNIVLEIIDEKTEYESCWINANSNDIEKYQLAWDDYQAELERQEEQERLENIGNGDVFSKISEIISLTLLS